MLAMSFSPTSNCHRSIQGHKDDRSVHSEGSGQEGETTVYGNYILQGLLELGTNETRDRIGQKIIDDSVVSLLTKVYG